MPTHLLQRVGHLPSSRDNLLNWSGLSSLGGPRLCCCTVAQFLIDLLAQQHYNVKKAVLLLSTQKTYYSVECIATTTYGVQTTIGQVCSTKFCVCCTAALCVSTPGSISIVKSASSLPQGHYLARRFVTHTLSQSSFWMVIIQHTQYSSLGD